MKLWPFEVVEEGGRPKIRVRADGRQQTFYPEEISAMVLGAMKEAAEAHLGGAVRSAVVTVPAYFNDAQRQATKDAGQLAGLKVLRIINEPTAAALAHGFGDAKDESERNVLIFDLGGGTFDVSVLTIEEGVFEVRSTAGDTHLGGEDMDARLVRHCAQEFSRKHNRDISGDKRALRRLRTACEKAKRLLSSATQASVELELLHDGIDCRTNITRACFEQLCEDLFQATLAPLAGALRDAEMSKSQIDQVVLVGGSTRIPRVRALLRDYFGGKELDCGANPDEAVAAGAAVQAAILEDDGGDEALDIVLVNVTPLSLGIEVQGGIMSTIIKRNTRIPATVTATYTTVQDFQTSVDIVVYEGERQMSKDNNLLGKFVLGGIPPALRRVPKLDVTFEIDVDGILHVTATVRSNQNSNSLTITSNRGRLTKEQIEHLLLEAERYSLQDQKRKEAAEARNRLEDCCYKMKRQAASVKSGFEKQIIVDRCEETEQWLATHTSASKENCDQKKKELEEICEKIMNM